MAGLENVVMVGPWGRTGTGTGTFWKHELHDVHAQYTIIIIGYAAGINYVNVESADNWDNIEHHPERSGAGVGESIAVIPLGPDEYIKEHYFGFSEPDAKYLSWLRFVTSKDKKYGPYGTVTASEFSLPVTRGKPLGFFGWNEAPISSIGFEFAPGGNVVMLGPWGLNEGPFFQCGDSLVTKIGISYGDDIDHITVESSEKSDINKHKNKHHPKRSGAGVDEYKAVIPLGPDEFIKDYFVYVEPDAKSLSALSFTTNKRMYGPYGTVTTSVVPLPVTKGKIIGFFGHNEGPIKSIGIQLAP